jgi:hypothetical protein
VDWTVSDYESFRVSGEQRLRFNRGGQDLTRMLELQMAGKLDSWAIRWAYAHCKHEALALLSLRPRVFHIGSDGSGTHSRKGTHMQLPLTSEYKSGFAFPAAAELDPRFVTQLQAKLRPSQIRTIARYFYNKVR